MCGSKPPAPPPPPPPPSLPPPAPTPIPSEVAPQQTAEQRRNRVNALKFGAASTIKTSPQGLTGQGSDLTGTGKKTIGS
jgi:hypothetical protein